MLISASVITAVVMLGFELALAGLTNNLGEPVAQKRLGVGFQKKRCF